MTSLAIDQVDVSISPTTVRNLKTEKFGVKGPVADSASASVGAGLGWLTMT